MHIANRTSNTYTLCTAHLQAFGKMRKRWILSSIRSYDAWFKYNSFYCFLLYSPFSFSFFFYSFSTMCSLQVKNCNHLQKEKKKLKNTFSNFIFSLWLSILLFHVYMFHFCCFLSFWLLKSWKIVKEKWKMQLIHMIMVLKRELFAFWKLICYHMRVSMYLGNVIVGI